MKVLIIDNYDSFTYNLVQLIKESGLCDLKVLSYDDVNENVIEPFDKFIISPGPGIPSDFPKLQEYVLKFYTTKDILGVCLGHEAIALAFGGEIFSSGKVFHGFIKQTKITDPGNHIFKGIPDQFDAGCYHSWIINKDTFPKELKITAVAEDGVIMALSHKQYNVVGFQYHPESIMTKFGKQMVRNWLIGSVE
ncbi:MAG: aminodeoxychorismate/anthranilate synthase component II [Bacteroidales bacterium]|nr:aminodeoxychorismate/anthranilate synthase component II [Bacteroidales bacterium]